ncbi:MAG: OmpA family protein [Chitinispirillaceae bacterium]|nr:OmpA family protein [Chitinispirillaceae bacterium]
MKTLIRGALATVVACFGTLYALDHNPISAGNTQGRNELGRACEAPFHNPALLGVERAPRGGLMIGPISDIGVGMWSDKLTLSPFNRYWVDSTRELSALLSKILKNSFKIDDDLSTEEVSEKLTKGFDGGFNVYTGVRYTLFNIAHRRVAFDITTHVDEQVRIPEGPLYAIFSETDGLLRGNTLDFSNFKQDGLWATDFTFNFGLPVSIPALHNFFKLRYGAGGIGLKYVAGHSVLHSTMKNGKLTYNEVTEALEMDGDLTIRTAGTGLHGPWKMENPFKDRVIPEITGHGAGFDIGGILYDDKGTLSLNFQNIGVVFWLHGVKEVTYKISKDDLTAYDIIQAIDQVGKSGDSVLLRVFNRNENEFISGSSDTLKDANGFTTVLPINFNFGYARTWDLKHKRKRYLADYVNANANYQQALAPGAGTSFWPRLSFGGEVGTLYGTLPLRAGYVLGGPERLASAAGATFNFRYFTISGSYKALGHLLFWPRRGMELAAGLCINWGMGIDSDKDGIPDHKDKCPYEPEDPDGFEDEDGCPDYDNDKDGILDVNDKCPNDPEDKDGFEDEDGCPDYDNDFDGIPDSTDKCPNEPEDRDQFQDEDGCPDYDNDGDNIPDSLDKCPNVPEDIDLFEDQDGCPDYDNDKDGIPDSLDRCINEPENFNGFRDEDGCPDTLVRPSEKEVRILNTKLRDINFKTASAELLPASHAALDFIVGFLKQYQDLRYEIQGHTDSRGEDDYNLLLSAARAATVRAYLLNKGIPDANLIAIGYGEGRPIADNKTAKGRAKNRRVEFRFIETQQDYQTLKAQEEVFRQQIRDAKIKGAEY